MTWAGLVHYAVQVSLNRSPFLPEITESWDHTSVPPHLALQGFSRTICIAFDGGEANEGTALREAKMAAGRGCVTSGSYEGTEAGKARLEAHAPTHVQPLFPLGGSWGRVTEHPEVTGRHTAGWGSAWPL